jgi:hypothetical protein
LQAEYAEETIGVLSAQLLNTVTELRNIRDTLGGRLLSRYAHIKHSRILPIYRQFRQRFVKPIQPESLLDNHERVATIDKDSGGG